MSDLTPEDLPLELGLEVAPYMSLAELVRSVQVSKRMYSLFAPSLLQSELKVLFQFIANGQQEKAKKILHTNQSLILMKGSISNDAGFIFKNISAFQYAFFFLDTHMWVMLEHFFPNPKFLDEQLQEIENGIDYSFTDRSGVTTKYHGKHFDYHILLSALKNCCDNYYNWDINVRNKYWVEEIGSAQRLCSHVVQHYLDRYWSNYEFNTDHWYRNKYGLNPFPIRTDKYYFIPSRFKEIFPLERNQGLGTDYAIYRAEKTQAILSDKCPNKSDLEKDLEILTLLFAARQEEANDFIKRILYPETIGFWQKFQDKIGWGV